MSIYGVYQFFNSDFLEIVSGRNALGGFQEGWDSKPSEGQSSNDPKLDIVINQLQKHSQFLILLVVPALSFINSKLHKKLGYNFAEHLVIVIYAVSFSVFWTILLGTIWTPFITEESAEYFIYSSYFIHIVTITWVLHKSVRGAFYKYLLALIFSFFCLALYFHNHNGVMFAPTILDSCRYHLC